MDIYSILNFFKWQAKIRLPHGGLYERAFGEKPKVDEMLEKYIYFDDIYKSRILKYLFGSYLINEETLNEFYLFLQEYYYDEQSDCYKFNIGKKDLYLPVPQDEEKKGI